MIGGSISDAESCKVLDAFTKIRSCSTYKAQFGYEPTAQDYRDNNRGARDAAQRLVNVFFLSKGEIEMGNN